jgi:O-antigen ligase
MAMILIVIGYYLLRSGWIRLPLLIAVGAGSIALLLTFSRAAWLGAFLGGAGMLVLLLWTLRRRRWSPNWSSIGLLAALLLTIGIVFALRYWPLLRPRLGLASQGVEIRSVEERTIEIDAVGALIEMRPWLGVGLGNFPTALYELARETVAAYPVYQPAHNVLLLSTAELGLLGGALWLALLVAPWLALWFKRRQAWVGPWWAGLSGALAGLFVVSFFDAYTWSSHQGRLLLWLLWGLWASEWSRHTRLEETA